MSDSEGMLADKQYAFGPTSVVNAEIYNSKRKVVKTVK